MSHSVTPTMLAKMKSSINPDDSRRNLAERAVTVNGIYSASESNVLSATNTMVFSDEVSTGSVTNQKESGRCWLFATLNTIRHQIEKDHKIEDFELSESYSYFWDKLERANTFYEKVIATSSDSLEDRHMVHLFAHPQVDGGWWEYSAAVIEKYGVVPQSVMPESIATSKSNQLNTLLNRKLRKDALELREAKSKKSVDTQALKDSKLAEVYRILTIAIGTPPESFSFSFKDKDKKLHREDSITPKEFLSKYGKRNFDDYVSVVNYPSVDRPFMQTYTFEGGGNVTDGKVPLFLNVDIETLKALTLKQIKSGEAVWFACDTQVNINKKGYMSSEVYDFKSTFDVDFDFDKADRLAVRDASVDHAVTITGVDCVNDIPKQWKIENSWGDDIGHKGYFTMSSEWFDANGYVVVIRKDLLSKELQDVLTKPPIQMPDWDPLNMQ